MIDNAVLMFMFNIIRTLVHLLGDLGLIILEMSGH